MTLEMPANYFSPGDECWLLARLGNPEADFLDALLVVVLEVNGSYFFWDDWTTAYDAVPVLLPSGRTVVRVIAPFVWPDTGTDSVQGLTFVGALLDPESGQVMGDTSAFSFGYGPRTGAS